MEPLVVLPNGFSISPAVSVLIQLMQVPVHWFGAAACYPTCQVSGDPVLPVTIRLVESTPPLAKTTCVHALQSNVVEEGII